MMPSGPGREEMEGNVPVGHSVQSTKTQPHLNGNHDRSHMQEIIGIKQRHPEEHDAGELRANLALPALLVALDAASHSAAMPSTGPETRINALTSDGRATIAIEPTAPLTAMY